MKKEYQKNMNKKELRKLLASDRKRYNISNTISRHELKKMYGYQYMRNLRKTKFYKESGSKLRFYIYKLRLEKMEKQFGFQISYATDIGPGFYIGHFGHVIINWKVKIGKNVNVFPGVTIGQTNRGEKKGVPTIGSKVWVGTNAVIVGNIKIGNDVLIAPNSYVNFDVPSHSIVIGNPGQIYHKENATEEYIENIC